MTNADVIRNMTDKELAYLLAPSCPPFGWEKTCTPFVNSEKECTECRIQWLQSESTERDMMNMIGGAGK